jgi:hypothetical protein
MIISEAYQLKALLDSFLGNSKNDLDESYQIQYPCPKCVQHKGISEKRKYNLEVNLQKGVYNAWCCSQYDEDMHGSILKLIKIFGNETILKEYKEITYQIQKSKLYDISFQQGDFRIDVNVAEKKEVELPINFVPLIKDKPIPRQVKGYLEKRKIDWGIIQKYHIGYTSYDKSLFQASLRIIIPSFNKYGELNYWVGRDFTQWNNRMKYLNPLVDKTSIIFNEEKIKWDADITLVEGPFDHIVVPNSIPLLGKSLKETHQLYYHLRDKANANINIWLDVDCPEDTKKLYNMLNHGKLKGKIRYIPSIDNEDPSSIYEKYGKKGIIKCLQNSIILGEKEIL